MKKYAVLPALVVWGLLSGHASAQWGELLSGYVNANLPQSAQQPSAGSGQPTPRTCGYGSFPFSLDRLIPSPAVKTAVPLVIRNPYYTGSWQVSPLPVPSGTAPLVIKNPYVTDTGAAPPAPPAAPHL
jgi:hypothetical protein